MIQPGTHSSEQASKFHEVVLYCVSVMCVYNILSRLSSQSTSNLQTKSVLRQLLRTPTFCRWWIAASATHSCVLGCTMLLFNGVYNFFSLAATCVVLDEGAQWMTNCAKWLYQVAFIGKQYIHVTMFVTCLHQVHVCGYACVHDKVGMVFYTLCNIVTVYTV